METNRNGCSDSGNQTAEEAKLMIKGYPKIIHFGSRGTEELFKSDVVVQEKIDGSQFRFVKLDGKLHFFSRGGEKQEKDGLFGPAMTAVEAIADGLTEGLVVCGEAVAKPKHNIVAYCRVPAGNVAVFDVYDLHYERWWAPDDVQALAAYHGLETVETFFQGRLESVEQLKQWQEGTSALGGVKEGIVIKNYEKEIFVKLVAEQFLEIKGAPKGPKPKAEGFDAFLETLANKYGGEARRHKAYQHLRDEGLLDFSTKDIGLLIKEIYKDIEEECSDELKQELYERALPKILKHVGPGMAMWYKTRLATQGSATAEAGYQQLYGNTSEEAPATATDPSI